MSERYKREIIEAVDDTLERVLGTTIKEVIYAYISHEYDIKTQTGYRDLREFVKALRKVIGEGASAVIEKLVVKRLCASLSLKDIDESYSLLDLIDKLKGLKEEGFTRIEKKV